MFINLEYLAVLICSLSPCTIKMDSPVLNIGEGLVFATI
jgi:hypothetical protein